MDMKIKYDYSQFNQMIFKNNINKQIDTSIMDISKGKKKNIDKIIKIEYLKGEDDNIKIFGEDFIKNNRYKCKIIYKNKKNKLKAFMENKEKNKNIKIKLQLLDELSNLDSMFEE